ncbi:MAG: hypothetical protein K2I07_06375 [Lachnospiraceae bacterium]|nr:hypothetical protein [Lachnospiraceae bacterium]
MKGMEEMRLNAYLFEPLTEENEKKDEDNEEGNGEQEIRSKVKSYTYILKRAKMLCYQMILKERTWKKWVAMMVIAAVACMGGILWIGIGKMEKIKEWNFIIIICGVLSLMTVVSVFEIIKRIEAMHATRERIYSRTSNFQVSYQLPEITGEAQEFLIREFADALEQIATSDYKRYSVIRWSKEQVRKAKHREDA